MIRYLALAFADPIHVSWTWSIAARNDLDAIEQLIGRLRACPDGLALAKLSRTDGPSAGRVVAALNLKPKKE